MYLKYIFGVVTLCLLVFTLAAQEEQTFPCYYGISTDPDNPVDTICGNLENTFDWRTEMFEVANNPALSEIQSPFWDDENPSLSFLAEPFFPTFRDFELEDGWELLHYRMDYAPNDDYVYFILYNKYESLIRVFTTLPQLGSPNNSTAVKVNFRSGDASALLSPFSGQSQSLDMESIGVVEQSNVYYNNSFRFTYFDIPVEYDPCTCLSQNSSIGFSFGLVNEQELDIYTRYTEVEQLLASQIKIDEDSRIAPDEFLAGINDGVAGASTYQTWNQLQSYYRNLSSEVSDLKKQYNRIQAFDKVLSIALKAGGGDILSTLKIIDTEIETGDTLSNGEAETVIIKGKHAAELFLGGLNLFGAGVKKKLDAATGQLKNLGSATLTLGEQVSQGTIVGQYEVGGPDFSLPGTATNCADTSNYPLYNEVLGRMALLEKPEVSLQVEAIEGEDQAGEISTFYPTALFSIDPSSIDYVFNPAAQINEEATEINAMLRVYDLDNRAIGSPNLTSLDDVTAGFVSPLLPLGCIGDYVSQIDFSLASEYSDPNLQIDLILFVAYAFNDGNQALQQYTYSVEITEQVIVGAGSSATPLFTSSTPALPTDIELEATDYTEDEFIFAYGQIDIVGDQRLANFTETTTTIIVDGELIETTVELPGEEIFVEIVAPQVIVNSDVDLIAGPPEGSGGEILLRADDYFQDCDPLLPVSGEDVLTFCGSDNYMAKYIQAGQSLEGLTPAAPPTPIDQFQGEPMTLSISPNPVGNYASITLNLPKDEVVTISIVDITGRTMATLVESESLLTGHHYFDLPGHLLLPGSYILRAQTQTETVVSRFIR